MADAQSYKSFGNSAERGRSSGEHHSDAALFAMATPHGKGTSTKYDAKRALSGVKGGSIKHLGIPGTGVQTHTLRSNASISTQSSHASHVQSHLQGKHSRFASISTLSAMNLVSVLSPAQKRRHEKTVESHENKKDLDDVKWGNSGEGLLGQEYKHGLSQRVAGSLQNFAEHKLLKNQIQDLKSQREGELHRQNLRMSRERGMILRQKDELEQMRNRARNKKRRKKEDKFQKDMKSAMTKAVNPLYMKRKTQMAVEEIATLAQTRSVIGAYIRKAAKTAVTVLAVAGIEDEDEKRLAQLILEIKDEIVARIRILTKKYGSEFPTAGHSPEDLAALLTTVQATKRQQFLDSLAANWNQNRQKDSLVDINFNNQALSVKADNVNSNNEAQSIEATKQLHQQSLLLQSHPFVIMSVLLGNPPPKGYGGLGGKEIEKSETKQFIVKKKRTDSFDPFEDEAESKPGYYTMLDVCKSINMIERMDVTNRVKTWLKDVTESNKASANAGQRTSVFRQRSTLRDMMAPKKP